ncbi:MAG: NAD-binding protein [Steroidobacteraceae bacterium]
MKHEWFSAERTWLRKEHERLQRSLHMRVWFPQLPLALLVGIQGLVLILLGSGSLRPLLQAISAPALSTFTGKLGILQIGAASHIAIGVLLLLVALGMLWRSRLAWLLAFLLSLAVVALEFSPLSHASRLLQAFSIVQLLLLLAARQAFMRASLATATVFALTGVLITLGYGTLGALILGTGFQPRITTVINATYFAVETMSTVGYGDITPVTSDARLFTISLIVLGLGVFATALPAIAGPLIDKRLMNLLQPRKRGKMKRVSHVIVVGDGPLAQDTSRALIARGLLVTSIVAVKPPENEQHTEDVLVGDGSDTELLRQADIDKARAVLALSEDDSYNAFVVLAAKEMNPELRTVAAVSDTRNTGRLARTRPDVLLTLPLLGGELLAMALSGEQIQTDALITQLMKLG